MKQYLQLLQHIIDQGDSKDDRTGTGTTSIFGYQMRFNLAEGFPLLTTKKIYLKAIIYELLWFLRGDTNIKYLVDNDVNIWNEWAFQKYLESINAQELFPKYSENWQGLLKRFVQDIKTNQNFAGVYGELGPIYGKQWVKWQATDGSEINQIQDAIDQIKNDPTSRRIIVNGWNVGEIQDLVKSKHNAPPPCHLLFQFIVVNGKLSCQLYQRSADVFLGVPFNIASYSLLTMMMAQVCDLQPGEFIHTFGDVHLYNNHREQAIEQLKREPRPLPTIKINPDIKSIFDFEYGDFELVGYNPHPAIKAQVAV